MDGKIRVVGQVPRSGTDYAGLEVRTGKVQVEVLVVLVLYIQGSLHALQTPSRASPDVYTE